MSFLNFLVFLSALLFGNTVTLAYSLAGAIVSLTVMSLLKLSDKLTAVGVSVAGGVTHNLGQVAVAAVILNTPEIGYYMTVLAVTGTLSGIFIGLCGALMIKRVPPEKIFRSR